MLMYQNQAEKLIQTLVNCIPEINDDSKKIISQWGDVYKQGFENLRKAVDDGYARIEEFFNKNAISMFHDQTEKMFSAFFNQTNWMPDDLRKTVDELTDIHKKSCENFSKQVDESIRCMENFKPAEKGLKTDTKKKKLTP